MQQFSDCRGPQISDVWRREGQAATSEPAPGLRKQVRKIFYVLEFLHISKDAEVPVTLREYLTLMEALDADLAEKKVEDFYISPAPCS